LLLAGVPLHVVSRRLGHRDIQTTINTYGHVTDDAELRGVGELVGHRARLGAR
jgi:integrase